MENIEDVTECFGKKLSEEKMNIWILKISDIQSPLFYKYKGVQLGRSEITTNQLNNKV